MARWRASDGRSALRHLLSGGAILASIVPLFWLYWLAMAVQPRSPEDAYTVFAIGLVGALVLAVAGGAFLL